GVNPFPGQRHLDHDVLVQAGEIAPLAQHPFVVLRHDFGAGRAVDDVADALQVLAIVARLLRQQRRVGGDAVDDAERHQGFDFLDVPRVDEEFHGCSPWPTGLVSSPTPSTFMVTRSPATRGPIPAGVPVETMSPGNSVITDEMNAMRFRIEKINSRVDDDWRFTPLTHPSTASPCGESKSSPVAMHGPTGAKVSKPFARVYWTSLLCSSPAVTSFTQVMPKMYSCASSSRTCAALAPMTTPASAS